MVNFSYAGEMKRTRKTTLINVAEAKARLPELMERAASGETILLGRYGKPRARLVPLDSMEEMKARRIPGGGQFGLKPGWEKKFDAMDAEIEELFYGKGRK